jgi:hypothetical protein
VSESKPMQHHPEKFFDDRGGAPVPILMTSKTL